MPSDRIVKCLQDVIDAIDLIETWIAEAGGADQAIYHDPKTRSAVERQLLVMSEAAIRLDKLDASAGPRLAPNIDWPGIRGIGNFIRHKYDDLDTTVLVDVLRNRMRDLRDACVSAIDGLNAR